MNCIFCDIDKNRIIAENEEAFAIYYGFSVSKGHVIVLPKAHFNNYFEVDQHIKDKLCKLIDE